MDPPAVGLHQQQRRNLRQGGEPTGLQLAVEDGFLLAHFEGTRGPTDEFDLDLFVGERLLDFSGQTDRLRPVVSALAVFDFDLHGRILARSACRWAAELQ